MGRRIQGQNTPAGWDQLTDQERDAFTMGGSIPKLDWFIDGMSAAAEHDFFSTTYVEELVQKAHRREENYYGYTDRLLYECLDAYGIQGKSVAVLGTTEPWYEAVTLVYGGTPTTIEYNTLTTDDDRLNIMTVDEYNKNPIKFDAAISISSFEHDGLGRYGDPIDPDGDLKAMKNVRENVLNPGGLLYLSVPIGLDKCVWNAHRIYGQQRWPKLIEGFELLHGAGLHDDELNRDRGAGCYQPVAVLRNNG